MVEKFTDGEVPRGRRGLGHVLADGRVRQACLGRGVGLLAVSE